MCLCVCARISCECKGVANGRGYRILFTKMTKFVQGINTPTTTRASSTATACSGRSYTRHTSYYGGNEYLIKTGFACDLPSQGKTLEYVE